MARILRVEFDPAFLTASSTEKARAADLHVPASIARRGRAHEDLYLARRYDELLASAEYVAHRRAALQGFNYQQDAYTAVCLAEAARRDPHYAALRYRLRQMDERRRMTGDQRDQFGQLMRFLRGETPGDEGGGDHGLRQPEPAPHEGVAGDDDGGGVTAGNGAGLSLWGNDEEPV